MLLSRPAPDRSLTTKHPSGSSRSKHQPQRHHCQSEQLHRQCRANVRCLRSPRGHHTSVLMRVRRTQLLLRSEPAACLQFLVAAHSCRQGRRRLHPRLKYPQFPAGRAPTCQQHQSLRTMNVEKAITRATTTPTLHRAQSTRTP